MCESYEIIFPLIELLVVGAAISFYCSVGGSWWGRIRAVPGQCLACFQKQCSCPDLRHRGIVFLKSNKDCLHRYREIDLSEEDKQLFERIKNRLSRYRRMLRKRDYDAVLNLQREIDCMWVEFWVRCMRRWTPRQGRRGGRE